MGCEGFLCVSRLSDGADGGEPNNLRPTPPSPSISPTPALSDPHLLDANGGSESYDVMCWQTERTCQPVSLCPTLFVSGVDRFLKEVHEDLAEITSSVLRQREL